MHLTKKDIQNEDRLRRLNIINSITGIKPANLIGTVSKKGISNLAIFSSVLHLGSNPALIGFILRPAGKVRRHTYENLIETGQYTINSLHFSQAEQGHYTSAKFEDEVSEFEPLGFTPELTDGFAAPFVKESRMKFGLRFVEEIPIPLNGTSLIIGEVQHLILDDGAVDENGYIDLENLGNAGISGLNSYYRLTKIADYPYARPNELPASLAMKI